MLQLLRNPATARDHRRHLRDSLRRTLDEPSAARPRPRGWPRECSPVGCPRPRRDCGAEERLEELPPSPEMPNATSSSGDDCGARVAAAAPNLDLD